MATRKRQTTTAKAVISEDLKNTVPQRKGQTVLAKRDGRYKWFTEKAWGLLSDVFTRDQSGREVRLSKQGWTQVPAETLNKVPEPVE